MGVGQLLHRVNKTVKLHGDEDKHEDVDAWKNRDLIPLPPEYPSHLGFFEYYGYWSLGSLNVSTWQMPNTFLTAGLSVGQSMGVIIIARAIVGIFSTFVAWCGLRYHIGFTIQNRFSWGMRGSYIPLIQRVMLNFIWNATQCWTGGKLVAVCLTAIFPSFYNLPNSLPESFPATSYDMVGFFLFWFCSLPFLWIPPEMIWSLSVAKGVGPIFYKSEAGSTRWSTSWLMLKCINSAIGGKAAGMTNGSDFSRYGKTARGYIGGTVSCLFATGTMVSFVGLVIYWNPPDLLMRMMENGQGSSKARAGVFFLAVGFALTSGFENICGNAVAGGVDLAGMFPKYINIRRGAIITFVAAWIVMPWQLINVATTFLTVLSSFSVFLAPIMGLMAADFFVIRRQRIKLSALYQLHGSYYYTWGVNWRTIPVWLAGWAPTVGGLAYTAGARNDGPGALYELYYLSFFLGFFISFFLFILVNYIFPPSNLGDVDDTDVFGAFTEDECRRMGIASQADGALTSEDSSVEKLPIDAVGAKESDTKV
ncbi:hypothetical protein BDZ89DRAFT_1084353 [Hymenopellis radicata]|nr:hypothetical protein BDZ89DRAFT_1084353 [Hymenopellis radicata]